MKKHPLLWLAAIALLGHIVLTLIALAFPATAEPLVGRLQTPLLLLFGLTHAAYALGWRRMLVFFALSAGISWAFEQVGVATGWVYGGYYYARMIGPRLGHVPLLVPLGWFMMMYPSYVIANLLVTGRFYDESRGLARLVWLSFIGAMVMTAWDLAMDPIFTRLGMWVWEEPGPYFGVPIQNFAGWIATTFTVYLLFRLWLRGAGARPRGAVTRVIAAMPLAAYASQGARMFAVPEPEMGLIAFFAMGLPLFLAAGRLFETPESAGSTTSDPPSAPTNVDQNRPK
ncbi:MAG: carotenoid biosynthesis protein [Chloroflexi bacterium]|nr:carotenoid biosynthesis protein [Chloroflexota bacterium]